MFDGYMTIKEIAEIMSVSKPTVRKMIRQDQIAVVRLDGIVLVKEQDVKRMIEKRTQQ